MGTSVQHNFSGWRVAVFGAGYVGSAVVRQVVSRGASVVAVTRNPVTADALRMVGAEVCIADLAEARWHGRLEGDFDLVVNCVGAGGGGIDGYRRSYLEGMHSVLRWCSERTTGALVYTSSTSVYAQGGGVRVDESSPARGRNPRAAVLVETEESLMSSDAAIRRRVVLRLAGIYGPNRHLLLDQLRAGAEAIAGSAEQHLNLIHRDDVVRAILVVATEPGLPERAIFNVSDGGEASRGEVVAWLCERLGRPVPVFGGESSEGARGPVPDRVIVSGLLRERTSWRPEYPSFRDGYSAILASS